MNSFLPISFYGRLIKVLAKEFGDTLAERIFKAPVGSVFVD